MVRLILIDDAEETHILVKKALGNQFEVTWAKSAHEGLRRIEESNYEIVLLDIMLPDGDGFQVCARLQKDDRFRSIPVIIMSAKTGTSNRVTGLSLGADDYLEKPVDPVELKTRIENRLSKIRNRESASLQMVRGQLSINFSNQTVRVTENSVATDLALTPLEFKILQYLARNEENTVSRGQLMTGVWGDNINVSDRTIDKHISLLRQKMGSCSSFIETVPGFGYRFSSNMKQLKAA